MSTETKERGRIVPQGAGGFLNPPTHPEHSYSVETDLQRRPDNRGSMSLSGAIESDWLDDETRAAARSLLEKWEAPDIDSPELIEWRRQVLGYFRNCYKGETPGPYGRGEWAAESLTIDSERDPLDHVDTHAGVHLIRRYYPEYIPTREDFEQARWGSK